MTSEGLDRYAKSRPTGVIALKLLHERNAYLIPIALAILPELAEQAHRPGIAQFGEDGLLEFEWRVCLHFELPVLGQMAGEAQVDLALLLLCRFVTPGNAGSDSNN
jgi:hypothetical protein